MQNASKLDISIFKEFYDSWDELSFESQKIRAQYSNQTIDSLLAVADFVQLPPGVDKEQKTKIRIGQEFFRKAVISSYESQCCITGINEPQLLIASHIKPWAVSDESKERTDPRNGLCLNALHDKAFDKGLLTITTDYRILLSDKLAKAKMDETTKLWLLSYNHKSIILPSRFSPAREFIEYHNDVIFQH
jgi:putative restriction endonuclease